MCIKDPIYKTCWKNGNDLSNEAPKIELWNHTKKTHFPVFAKNFCRPWMKLKTFFANFQILGPLGCQRWVVIPRNVKKSQNHCTLIYSILYAIEEGWEQEQQAGWYFKCWSSWLCLLTHEKNKVLFCCLWYWLYAAILSKKVSTCHTEKEKTKRELSCIWRLGEGIGLFYLSWLLWKLVYLQKRNNSPHYHFVLAAKKTLLVFLPYLLLARSKQSRR